MYWSERSVTDRTSKVATPWGRFTGTFFLLCGIFTTPGFLFPLISRTVCADGRSDTDPSPPLFISSSGINVRHSIRSPYVDGSPALARRGNDPLTWSRNGSGAGVAHVSEKERKTSRVTSRRVMTRWMLTRNGEMPQWRKCAFSLHAEYPFRHHPMSRTHT